MTAFHWEHRNPSSLHDTSIPVQSLSFSLFPQFFAMLSFNQPRLGFWGLKKWWKALLFWITLGRCNYSVLWNLHTVHRNSALESSYSLQTDIRKTPFDLVLSLTILSCDFWQLYQIIMPLDKSGIRWRQERENKTVMFPYFFLLYAIVQYLILYTE